MNLPTLEEMKASLRLRLADPAKQEIATAVMQDLVDLQARALLGEENIERELRQVRSQFASFTATEVQVVSDTFRAWMQDATRFVVGTAIAAAVG